MSLGFRRRLFTSSLVLVAVTNIGLGVYLESELRGRLQDDYRDDLRRRTAVMQQVLYGEAAQVQTVAQARAELDPVADRYGRAFDSRVSIVGPGGDLVGDSELAAGPLSKIDNHGTRPEVVQAKTTGHGLSRRYSSTVETDMLYAAARIDDGSDRVVRVSVPLSRIDEAVFNLRAMIALGCVIGLAVTALLAFIASRLLSRSLATLLATAKDEAAAASEGEVGPASDDGPPSVATMALDLRRSVRQLGRERARFETVLETMQPAVLGLDAKRRIDTTNRAARELLALPDDVAGRPLLDFVRLPAVQELICEAAAGRSGSGEFDYGTSPRRRLEAQANPAAHGGGVVLVMHDVTELRRLETIRKDFVANVSHELRTPVAVIQANAETLLGGALEEPERARVFLDAMARHADRLGRLVADLLDISRIEAGRYSLEIGPVDLVEMVDRTFLGLATPAAERETTLHCDISGDWWLAADDKALEQVLVNLVSNGIKYTQRGGRIEISASTVVPQKGRGAEQVRVEVRDDGPGIDPRHHARVFERFYRVDSGRAREQGGTGLGLAIVKHLVEAMGGQVGVDARRPRGSVFWFSIPSAATLGDDDWDDAEEPEVLAGPSSAGK